MNIFDIIGPVMVGPSSSHTAGAVKIGLIAGRLLGESPVEARIYFHGSFAATGKGHGTDKALVAGLLGLAVDDIKIPQSFEIAAEKELKIQIEEADLGEVHPNTVKLLLTGKTGKELELMASSIGGGQINVFEMDGLPVNFNGDSPTLIVHNMDRPGCLMEVTSILSKLFVNVATMQLHRLGRGGQAVMVMECDQVVPKDVQEKLEHTDGILKVIYFHMSEEEYV